MFELKGNKIKMRKNYARMISKGKLCPSELSNVLKIKVTSDLLGSSEFEYSF